MAAAYKAERAPGYELIPDVRNEATTIIAVTSLVIGLASTAAALLMKPKPPKAQEQREPTNFEGGDNVGKANFSPRYGFDSVQTLATLGKVVPLIFGHRGKFGLKNHMRPTHNDRLTIGGVRVDTQLIWSSLISKGRTQELRIAALLGHSRLGQNPEYEGYAIGTTKLESIPQERVFLAFNKDGRRPERRQKWCHQYDEGQLEIPNNQPDDLLAVQVYSSQADDTGWNLAFSGTFTPASNRAFGLYNQMPNATAWMEAYSSNIVPNNNSNNDDVGAIATDAGQDAIRLKLIKTLTAIPNGSGLYDPDDRDRYRKNGGRVSVNPGTDVYYEIGNDQYNKDDFGKEGAEDFNLAIQRKREEVDAKLEIGEIYQIGNFKAELKDISPNEPLQPGVPQTKRYKFNALEKGQYQIHRGYVSDWYRDEVSAGNSAVTPWYSSLEDLNVDNPPRDDKDNAPWGNNPTADCCLISAVEDAIISNTRKCNATEIGIKSTVYRKVTLPNVNAFPSNSLVDDIADSGGRLELGTMDRYLPRYSFFRILVRKSGYGEDDEKAGNDWEFLHGGIKFAIKGQTPEPQYNWIRIFHPPGETDAYEYRINPVPGWAIRSGLQSDNSTERVWLLNGKRNYAFGSDRDGVDIWGGFSLVFGGENLELTPGMCAISEFDRGPVQSSDVKSGVVSSLDKYDNGKERPRGWVMEEERYSDPSQENPTNFNIPRNKFVEKVPGYGGRTQFHWMCFWDDELLKEWKINNNLSSAPAYVQKDGKRYVCGPRTTEGNFVPGIFRYKIQKWGTVREPDPNIEVEKSPLNDKGENYDGPRNRLSGRGLKLTVYSYQDPFDPDDDTGNAAWWVISDGGEGYKEGEIAHFKIRGQNVYIRLGVNQIGGKPLYPFAAISDYPQYEGESISCTDGPEHEVAYVNQQILTYGAPATYDNLAYCTMRLTAGRQMTSFSQFSAYVKEGLKVERLIPDAVAELFIPLAKDREEKYSSCLFPEIAYALLSDPELGVGELVGRYQVNRGDMAKAAQFCIVNGFTWNGVLAERVNLREWIYEQASHNLLDFTVVGGRFSLKPSLLYTAEYRLDLYASPEIKGLFTDGNTNDLQVTFLEPAERQLFQANVVWREEEGNGFPKMKTTVVRLAPEQSNPGLPGGREENDPIEVFDLSNSVTSEAHAIYFAKYALRARQCIDHTITFKTAASELVGIEPGDYIKVTSACSHKARWNNGGIGPDGQITSTEQLGPNPRILYWRGYDFEGDTDRGVKEIDLEYVESSGRLRTPQTELWGSVFTQIRDNDAYIRVYRVTSISYADDGMISVSGAHSPLTYKYKQEKGSLILADWDEDDFEIETAI